jgi:hypothetical protein
MPNNLIRQIEAQTKPGQEPNTSLLVRMYRESTTDKPIMKLLQDIQQRASIYYNALEEIKKLKAAPKPSADTGIDTSSLDSEATAIKLKYENFGLIEAGNLPNPTAASICNYILDKLAKFARAAADILARHASEIAAELHIDPEVTVTFEVEIGWPPGFTIGVERSGHRNPGVAVLQASRV